MKAANSTWVVAFAFASVSSALRAQTTSVVSTEAGALGDQASSRPALSDDGRWIAFESLASNLVPSDTNGVADVFLHDRLAPATTRVSVGFGGAEANGESSQPSLSADGRWIAFVSLADNLVLGDTNAVGDVFVHDRIAGITARISVANGGVQANNASYEPALSGDGRYVAFTSVATNLVVVDGNLLSDVFLRDLQTGTTMRVSQDPNGSALTNNSSAPAVSFDGRYVAYESLASQIVVGDINQCSDVFLLDRQTGLTRMVSVRPNGGIVYQPSFDPAVSSDGRYVAFHSQSAALAHGADDGYVIDTYVRDMQATTTSLVSISDTGAQGSIASRYADVSNDGRFVVFDSASPEFVPSDTNPARDVFVRDLIAGTTQRISVESHGNQGDGDSGSAAISGDGRYVAFASSATTLVIGDTNAASDVFLHDRLGATPSSEVYCTTSTSSIGCVAAISAAGNPSASSSAGFTLSCSGIEGQRSGLFFYGASGSTALPWAFGSTSYLCVQPPTQRTTFLSSGGAVFQCNGSLSIDVLAFWSTNPAALGLPLTVGERFDAQAWFRDPPAPKTTNLSDAVRFWMTP